MDVPAIASVTARVGQIMAMAQAAQVGAAATASTPVGGTTTGTSAFGAQLSRAQATAPVTAPAGTAATSPAQTTPMSDADLAAHIDRWIAARTPSSPLAGHGAVFVAAGRENGIDPRLLVAIAAQESGLGTAGSGRDINNPFGWGPAIAFRSWSEAIHTVAGGLARGYVGEGRDTIAAIQGKWAPVGAANDPGNLNAGWTVGVSRLYAELGGDPSASVATGGPRAPEPSIT